MVFLYHHTTPQNKIIHYPPNSLSTLNTKQTLYTIHKKEKKEKTGKYNKPNKHIITTNK